MVPGGPITARLLHLIEVSSATMSDRRLSFALSICLPILLCMVYGQAHAQTRRVSPAGLPAHADSVIPNAQLLQPADLAQLLRSPTGAKPLILQVGSHIFFEEAHIPGSEYVGAAGEPSGHRALRRRVGGLSRLRPIIIYCGCCPWKKCPNIRPAYRELISRGFSNVKVLYLPRSFAKDWVDKGYPVAKGD